MIIGNKTWKDLVIKFKAVIIILKNKIEWVWVIIVNRILIKIEI